MDSNLEILQWYAEQGVDIALEENPVDRFSEKPPAPKQIEVTGKSPADHIRDRQEAKPAKPAFTPTPAMAATLPDATVIQSAWELSSAAQTIEQLKKAMSGFEGCNLRVTAKNMVFADGNPEADIMFVGEAPGRDEDIQGLPFVGRSGQLLDRMLAAIDLTRENAYISNVIPWRPPGNRPPTPHETEICRPFIERHIELAKPKLLVMLGGSSAKTLLKTTDGIMRLRGKWSEVATGNITVKAMPTLHPAYLLRQPAHKKLVWQDFLKIKRELAETGS